MEVDEAPTYMHMFFQNYIKKLYSFSSPISNISNQIFRLNGIEFYTHGKKTWGSIY